ncbi:MAG TPA: glutamate-5-semialdehyde dehydrogenase [Elusimicrobia bacterium]|nr:glutamate-5-semialdehyde dehydrogenase [Elusimicrobiota bacterium]
MNNIKNYIIEKAERAKNASKKLGLIPTVVKNRVLLKIAENILKSSDRIISENLKDIKNAEKQKLSSALIDRLKLNEKRLVSMSDGLKEIAKLPDPVGEVIEKIKRPNGLKIEKIRVPLGVIGIIYESRPNVTVDAVALCLKSGNCTILRGGSEAINSNKILSKIICKTAYSVGIPDGSVEFIDNTDRKIISEIIRLDEYLDCVIPRGGEGLIKYIRENSSVPVIAHGKGVCHVYVDKYADIKKAIKISFNAKVQRPGVCNAMETLLVHKDIAEKFLPKMISEYKKAGVEIRGCEKTKRIVKGIKTATENDWYTEYLDLILSVKVINSIDKAIEHIEKYGSHHSDAIITENEKYADKFLKEVDSAAVYHNASTRFTDGGEFGLGAEIGISTQKMHARGPMGLKELTSYKFVVHGNGQIRK